MKESCSLLKYSIKVINKLCISVATVQPRFNEPLYNEVLGITNDILQDGLLKCMEYNLDIAKCQETNCSVISGVRYIEVPLCFTETF